MSAFRNDVVYGRLLHMTPTHALKFAVFISCLTGMSACTEKPPEHSQISQQPPQSTQTADASIEHQSRFSTRARISYADLAALAAEEVPPQHTDTGKQKVCKKVLGLKLCGNARWQYTVKREGDIQVSGQDDYVILRVPMNFFGKAGIGGDVAKVLNMNAMDFAGAMDVQLRLKLDLGEDWCPVINTDVTYQWTQTPRLEWTAGIDINLKDQLDKAIKKQLAGLQDMASNAVDCEEFRATIETQWTQHSIPIDLPNSDTLYLNIEPNGFSFSGVKTEQDKLGLAFSLDAQTSVQSAELDSRSLTLPALERTVYQPGETRFNVLMRASYAQLESLAAEQIVGQSFSEASPAGDVSVTIESIALAGNPTGITLNLGFQAKLPGKKYDTPGNVYLTATPVLDAFTQKVRLDNIALSNVIDSTLWNTLAAVFNKKIISELENKAVLNVGPKLTEISALLEEQLADPARTGGLQVTEPTVNVILEKLIAEPENLAALVRVDTQLDIDIPIKTLYNERVKNKSRDSLATD